ncbi:hypothetical protein, partial [Enterobacter sichuanensis]
LRPAPWGSPTASGYFIAVVWWCWYFFALSLLMNVQRAKIFSPRDTLLQRFFSVSYKKLNLPTTQEYCRYRWGPDQ